MLSAQICAKAWGTPAQNLLRPACRSCANSQTERHSRIDAYGWSIRVCQNTVAKSGQEKIPWSKPLRKPERHVDVNDLRKGEALMALQSQLFHGDAKLEAAAVSDPAHIAPGATGAHVRKIQLALNRLDRAGLTVDDIYGQRTANAVLSFKQKRGLINRSYQSRADNIVGKMTIAALDQELSKKKDLGPLEITVFGDKASPPAIRPPDHPSFRLGFAFDAGVADVITPALRINSKQTRWVPGVTGTVRCAQTGGDSVATCTNSPDPSRDTDTVDSKVAFLSDSFGPSNPSAFPKPSDGGRVLLTRDPHAMRFETFRPGDATIFVRRTDTARILFVDVRADRLGPVNRPPLTKLTANSKFFSAAEAEGGEPDPGNVFTGRPVNPKRGGRLINLGGDSETPEFEDYQIDLDHSRGISVPFRPWTDDTDPSVRVPTQSATHIAMRGTPLFNSFITVIKRIAQPKCRFTFSGGLSFLDIIRSQLPGRELEPPLIDRSRGSVEVAWELN